MTTASYPSRAAQPSPRERAAGAAAAIAVQLLLGYALIVGLSIRMPSEVGDALKVFGVTPEPLPPPIEKTVPHPIHSKKPDGAASPPNLRATPTELVAPPPVVVLVQPPIPAAPAPGVGSDPSAGAADIAGPGTGSGGVGRGTGSGRSGRGGGDGGETPPRQIKGRLKNSDYPRAAGDVGVGGTVSVRYLVAASGRVTDCEVTRSSGSDVLDDTTCRLIMRRFRFAPSRDADGVPVDSHIVENHTWVVEQIPAPEQ